MDVLVQKVSTGDVVVFDKKTRDMILIDHDHGLEWDREQDKSLEAAQEFAKNGKAQFFSRHDLEKIQAALVGVVLLV